VKRRIGLGLATLGVAGALLAGCGGDDSDEPRTEVAPAQDSGSDNLVIEAERGAFNAQAVYESAAPGVVTISSIFPAGTDPLAGAGPQAGQGSGFVISDGGEIVTNAHVVTDGQATGSDEIHAAREVFVQFPDRNQVEAEIVGFDPFADVALLKVDPAGLEIDPIELGSLDHVQVGDPVAAIGSPFGERQSLSVGVISATDRSIPSLTEFQIDGAIQTDASINPGNSGGPLLDAEGKVIGINQQIDTTSGGNQGVGFAVPIDLASRAIDDLRKDGSVDYAFIGVTSQPLYPQLAEELDLDVDTGALIASVVAGGPADDAGICCAYSPDEEREHTVRFQATEVVTGGDVIVSVDGEELVEEADLPRIISRLEPGDTVTMEIIRDGERMDVEVELGTRPETAS
jgi:S1-C subfamily serine protease